jgi:hypothetical protein
MVFGGIGRQLPQLDLGSNSGLTGFGLKIQKESGLAMNRTREGQNQPPASASSVPLNCVSAIQVNQDIPARLVAFCSVFRRAPIDDSRNRSR